MFTSIHICVIPNHLTIMLKILRRDYNAYKEKSNLKMEGCYRSKAGSKENGAGGVGGIKLMYFASKCCGRNPGTRQVEVVCSDKMVIDLEFIHPLLFTFDKLPSLILLVPTYLF